MAAPASEAWPIKPSAKRSAPRLPPPTLSSARTMALTSSQGSKIRSPRAPLTALRTARAIAQALRQPDPAPPPVAQAPPTLKAKPVSKPTPPKKLAKRKPQRVARSRKPARTKPPFPPTLRPAEVSRPVFLDEMYVQQPGATLYGAYTRGHVVGRLPAAALVTHMGRHGNWVKVEAPNGVVGYVTAQALGPVPPKW
jgi:hypothetical protein